MVTPLARLRSLWRGIRRRSDLEAGMVEEFAYHLELRAADLVKGGMNPHDAARQARLEFGSTEHHLHDARRARGLEKVDRIRFSLLDIKLGVRMLIRYPGLTIVGGLAMAFAIWVGAMAFEFIDQVVAPTLPLRDGSRVVAVELWNRETSNREPRTAFEFARLTPQLKTLSGLGAWRERRSSIQVGNAFGESIDVADISPSAFDLAPRAPVLGRPLVAEDDIPGAPAVVVIGHALWRTRFRGDSGVIGQVVRVDGVTTTVVGVMAEGFAFPNAQQAWLPLRLGTVTEAGAGPPLTIFGRLAPGVTREDAQEEVGRLVAPLTRVGARGPLSLRASVVPFARAIIDIDGLSRAGLRAANVFLVLLVILVCGNIALLMFARAATRESEIVVRTALGAGRGRIVGQFFAEALVLGAIAAAIGLTAASTGLRLWMQVFSQTEGPLPFWFRAQLSPMTVFYAALLAIVGAAVSGVLPAMKVTRGLAQRLRETAAAAGGPRLGGIWTVVIVAQVAMTLFFPLSMFYMNREAEGIADLEVGFRDDEFVTARLVYDQEGALRDTSPAALAQRAARFAAAQQRLTSELAREPGVTGVTFAERMPRMYHPYRLIEVDEGGSAPLHPQWPDYRVSSVNVDRSFFEVLDVPVAGRGFKEGDTQVAIVNQSFVRVVLGDRQPIGRRLRYTYYEGDPEPGPGAQPGPWYEIIGVVPDMGLSTYSTADPKYAGIYHPAEVADLRPLQIAVHVQGGDPGAFGNRLREVADKVDPLLRVDRLQRISEISDRNVRFLRFWIVMLAVVSAIALVLSLAGIYAVMSFTVARRTREIGLRLALGAERIPLVLTILRRPLRQVALGVLAGTTFIVIMVLTNNSMMVTPTWVLGLSLYALAMFVVCLLACVVPTRRALAVEPTEALRADS